MVGVKSVAYLSKELDHSYADSDRLYKYMCISDKIEEEKEVEGVSKER